MHADVRAVLDWIAITQPDGSASILLGPERRPDLANAALVFMAGAGRDLAAMLAAEMGIRIDLTKLDRVIHAANDRWIPGGT